MNFAMQHWVAVIVIGAIFFYLGRKTSIGAGLPVIG